jgi:hypothetical protein
MLQEGQPAGESGANMKCLIISWRREEKREGRVRGISAPVGERAVKV